MEIEALQASTDIPGNVYHCVCQHLTFAPLVSLHSFASAPRFQFVESVTIPDLQHFHPSGSLMKGLPFVQNMYQTV